MPVVGLEPTRCRHQRILSPSRLPFHHTGVSQTSIYHPCRKFKRERRPDQRKGKRGKNRVSAKESKQDRSAEKIRPTRCGRTSRSVSASTAIVWNWTERPPQPQRKETSTKRAGVSGSPRSAPTPLESSRSPISSARKSRGSVRTRRDAAAAAISHRPSASSRPLSTQKHTTKPQTDSTAETACRTEAVNASAIQVSSDG